jgi:hypothetical protein
MTCGGYWSRRLGCSLRLSCSGVGLWEALGDGERVKERSPQRGATLLLRPTHTHSDFSQQTAPYMRRAKSQRADATAFHGGTA